MTQLLQNAVFGTALILAGALLRRALGGRLIPEARLALWFVCLIRLLAPVFPESGLSLWGLLPLTATAPATAPVIDPLPLPSGAVGDVPAAQFPAAGAANPAQPAAPAAFPWEMVVLVVWVGVGLLLAARYVLRWSRTRRAVAEAIPLPKDDPRYAPLPRCARLREGVMDGAPLTFGAVRPTVVLWPGLSGEALECVLAHESVHARRRDNLWHYAMGLALVVYWWNPAVWLMARLLRRDIELACDRAAVRKLGPEKRAEYAETLVALATAGAEPAFCRTFGRKATEERIISVMKFKKTTIAGIVLSLTLVAGVTVAFASGPKAPAGQSGDPSNNTPYEVCANPLCTVDYQHCHIDGEVVRAYDQYPGLLCAHPDCEIEGPHEHDGVQYAGQAGAFVVLSRNPGPLPSGDPVFVEDGNPVPAATGPIIVEDGDPGVTPPRPVTLEEYGALLEGLLSGGKVSQEDADWLLANAKEDMEGQECPYLWVVDGGSYAVMGGKFCTLADCGNNSRHTHDGEWYTGWADTVTYHGRTYNRADLSAETLKWLDWYLALPEEERLAVSYEPAELREQTVPEFVPDYDPSTEDSAGAGDDIICGLPTAPAVCPVEGCTVRGTHTHDGVTYLCNGAHCGGVCDGSCATAWNEADTAPTATPVSGGHHGDSHHGNGHHH